MTYNERQQDLFSVSDGEKGLLLSLIEDLI